MKNRGQLRGARLALYLLATFITCFIAGCLTAGKRPPLKCGALYAERGPNGWIGCPDWPFEGTTTPHPR